MAIQVSWLNQEHRMIQLQFNREWSWEELTQAVLTSHQLKDQYAEQGELILDMREVAGYKLGTITHAKALLSCYGQRFAKIIFVSAPFQYKALITMAVRLTKVADTLPNIQFIEHPDDLNQLYAFSET